LQVVFVIKKLLLGAIN